MQIRALADESSETVMITVHSKPATRAGGIVQERSLNTMGAEKKTIKADVSNRLETESSLNKGKS